MEKANILIGYFLIYVVLTAYTIFNSIKLNIRTRYGIKSIILSLIFLTLLAITILEEMKINSEVLIKALFTNVFIFTLIINILLARYIREKRFYKHRTIKIIKLILYTSNIFSLITFLAIISTNLLGLIDNNHFILYTKLISLINILINTISVVYMKVINETSQIKIFEEIVLTLPLAVSILIYSTPQYVYTSFLPLGISSILSSLVYSISPFVTNQRDILKDAIKLIITMFAILPQFYLALTLIYDKQILKTANSMTPSDIVTIFVALSSIPISLLLYKVIKQRSDKIIKQLVKSFISNITDEDISSLNIGIIISKLHNSITQFLGTNIIELYTFNNSKKVIDIFLAIDGDKGFIDKLKEYKLSDGDINNILSKSYKFLEKHNKSSLELFTKLDVDIIIPITHQNEIKFIVTIKTSDNFSLNEPIDIFISEVFYILLLETQTIITKELSKFPQNNVVLLIKNPDIRQEITTSLIMSNFNIFSANTYQEVMTLINKTNVEMLICDNEADNMSGINLIRNIKSNPLNSHIFSVLGFYETAEETSREFLESLADVQILLKDDFLHINNTVSYLTQILMSKKKLETTFKNITTLESYSTILLNKILGYKTTSFDEIEMDIISKILLQSSVNLPSFLLLGKLNSTLINSKLFAIIQEKQILYIDTINIPINFYSRKKINKTKVIWADHTEEGISPQEFSKFFSNEVTSVINPIYNFLAIHSENYLIIGFNYSSKVSHWDINMLESIIVNYLLMKTIFEEVKEVDNAFIYTMQSLARAAEEMDEETGVHIYRVGEYSKLIASFLGFSNEFCNSIYYASQMHDIGKLKIPREILRKPGTLTSEEFEIMKEHTIAGAIILGDHPKLSMAREIALSHHEKWDSSGYPYGLKENQIPVSARIVAIADIYDALRSPRIYKPELPHDKVVRIITEGDGRTKPQHFDPDILQAFKELNTKFEEIYEKYREQQQ
ncbi:MAG: HD domain-containing protein [Brevinematales bacterium]|nr:HD domain-containing protein [Brevinematales bacterium]